MGMTVLDPHGFPLLPMLRESTGTHIGSCQDTLLLQAAWYKVVGLSSVFHASDLDLLGRCSAVVVVRGCPMAYRGPAYRASGNISTGHGTAFRAFGSDGRMDMMCASLGLLALALYIRLRENFTLALFVASCVSAVNLFTHPNAIFGMIALAVIVLYFDRNRITIRALLLALLPVPLAGFAVGPVCSAGAAYSSLRNCRHRRKSLIGWSCPGIPGRRSGRNSHFAMAPRTD